MEVISKNIIFISENDIELAYANMQSDDCFCAFLIKAQKVCEHRCKNKKVRL